MLGGRAYDRWGFDLDGHRQVVQMRGSLLSNNADVARQWALAGHGIAYKSWLGVQQDVREGRLEWLLPQHGEAFPIQLACPHRKQCSPVIRRLHALLQPQSEALSTPVRD